MDQYIDPNSGAAQQPGAFAMAPLVEEPEEEHPDGNVTEPGEARSEAAADADSGNPEPLPDELISGGQHDAAIEHQAAPLGDQPGVEGEDKTGQVPISGAGSDDSDGDDSDDGDGDEGEGEGEGEGDEEKVASATGQPAGEGVEHPADGTMSPEISNVERPGKNGSKVAWVAYAKSQGATDEDLEGKTRDEIRDSYPKEA